ncbi:MAG: PIG-L family deacetylase, partial [Firmicutes bacterium]|nr:PIG-L family deacetylase [Bacillota bacterium]
MFVHAHPDDESSQSPATMSRYVDEGARVTLVTCTLGELGEILVPEWEHYTPEELGAKRVDELAKALEIVG